jgi:hypothetical protein
LTKFSDYFAYLFQTAAELPRLYLEVYVRWETMITGKRAAVWTAHLHTKLQFKKKTVWQRGSNKLQGSANRDMYIVS